MASTVDFIEYVMDTLLEVRLDLRYHRMFGEYCVYANDKPVLFVINDTIYAKQIPEIEDLMRGEKEDKPFPTAKTWYVVDPEKREKFEQLIYALEKNLPLPKQKKSKRCSNSNSK